MGRRFWLLAFSALLFLGRLFTLPQRQLADGQRVRVTATLSEEPVVFAGRQSFRLGEFKITASEFPEYHYGDQLEVMGKVKSSSQFQVLSIKGFKTYLLSSPQIEIKSSSAVFGIRGVAVGLERRLQSLFDRYYSRPLDGLVVGIVLGDKSLIPADFWEKLKLTGTLHLMVASGMNIAFLSGGILSFLTFFCRRKFALILLIFLIWFYSLLTGFNPPIIRAATMASLIFLAQFSGRQASGERVLWLAGLLMVLVNPLFLFDVGFQLSFLATAGLVYLQPQLQKSDFFLLRQENFASTIAAQLATLPILIGSFGQLNLISPVINFFLLWSLPLILPLGIIIGLVGLFWSNLGQVVAYLLLPFLIFIKQTVEWTAKISLFQVQLPSLKWYVVVGYYLLLACWVKKERSKNVGGD